MRSTKTVWHVNDKGEKNVCQAHKRTCEFYDRPEQRHFSGPNAEQEAVRAGESLLKKSNNVFATFSTEEYIPESLAEILKNAARGTHPKKISEKYVVENLFGGDMNKLATMREVNDASFTPETKKAIAKMAIRGDIRLSLNELNHGKDLDHGLSGVEILDDDFHSKDLKEYVTTSAAALPWN